MEKEHIHEDAHEAHPHVKEEKHARSENNKSKFGIPVAIIIGAVIVSGAIIFSQKGSGNAPAANDKTGTGQVVNDENAVTDITIPEVSENDHVLGNPNAKVVLVEYADFNCHFCGEMHKTLEKVIKEKGQSGEIAWVYRHFPIISPDSPSLAVSSECVAKTGNNDAFWKFANKLFHDREDASTKKVLTFVAEVGVDVNAYSECIKSGEMVAKVQEQATSIMDKNIQGTPHIFVLVNGKMGQIGGAYPYEKVMSEIDRITKESEK